MAVDRALDPYFEEAASWDHDRVKQYRRSARLGWTVAGAGWVGILFLLAALMLLMPLKRVEPFLIRVNDTTGVVDVVPVYAGEETLPQAVTRYFLTHYITVCQRFDYATAESDYEECGAFQTGAENAAWYAKWNPTNPASPLNLYKDGTTVRAEVSSVSFLTRADGVKDLAQVRYRTITRPGGGGASTDTDWIATIEYAYVKPSGDPKTRELNPLGFRIVDFQTEREALPYAPRREGAGATETSRSTTRPSETVPASVRAAAPATVP
jgi:type IV secretion system protein VirB8